VIAGQMKASTPNAIAATPRIATSHQFFAIVASMVPLPFAEPTRPTRT
jgi:hypothetical protein